MRASDYVDAVAVAAYSRGEQRRGVAFNREAVNVDARTADVVFSSEALVDRGGYYEVLSHEHGAIRGDRLDRGLAVLVNHDPADHVGVVESWAVDADRRGRAKLRFGVGARSTDIFQDVATGIRRGVSVRYIVHDFREEIAPDGRPLFRVVDWEPMEISLASIQADIESAVGRNVETVPALPAERVAKMKDETTAPSVVDVREVETRTRAADLARVNEILAIGERHGMDDLTRKAIATGQDIAEFRRDVLEALGKIQKVTTSPNIGMTERETSRYSFVRAINALANPQSRALQDAAGFEFECSAAAQTVSGRAARGIMVPHDVTSAVKRHGQRALNVATASAGGYLKATELRPESFIDLLRNKSVILGLGAIEMGGLVGDLAIPRLASGATAYWLSDETTAVTDSSETLGQMTLAPRVVGCKVDLSKKLLVQSTPAADMLVENDLAAAIGSAIDVAAFHGTGSSGQPTGIFGAAGSGISGIGSSYADTNGAAPTYGMFVGVETLLAAANGDSGSVAWVTNPKVRGKLRQVPAVNNTYGTVPVYTNQPGSGGLGEILGYPCAVTNNISSTTVRGTSGAVCSLAILGNWADAAVGMWTGVDLTVDPYSLSTTGQLRVVALQLVDFNVRHAASFAYLGGILTT